MKKKHKLGKKHAKNRTNTQMKKNTQVLKNTHTQIPIKKKAPQGIHVKHGQVSFEPGHIDGNDVFCH